MTPPRAHLTVEEEQNVDHDIDLTRWLQNIGIGLSENPASITHTIITCHHCHEAVRQLSDVLGPDTTTEEETLEDNKPKNNSTPVYTPSESPSKENTKDSDKKTERSPDSSESTPSSITSAKDPSQRTDNMSGEGSSTPK
uniref:Uncharacterized protein n=1 Tax=Moniliophthora roreri TaxID=221103 RepID=A0A0W0FEU5_MONRR